ncbi:MAG: hypothetical protein ACYCX3_11585 [Thermoleophilia bacterium]
MRSLPSRTCRFVRDDGSSCRSAPLKGEPYCFWHSPEHAEEADEARRLGGLRRRRERTVAGAFEFGGLGTVADIQRLLEVAVIDTLSLENSVARSRTLAYLGQTALKCLEVGELEDRLALLEAAVRRRDLPPAFDFDLDLDPEAEPEDRKELTP